MRFAEAEFEWMVNMTRSTGWGKGIKHSPAEGEEEFPKVVYDGASLDDRLGFRPD